MQLGRLVYVWENATKGDNCGKISNSVLAALCQGVSHVKQPLNNLGNTKVLQSCSSQPGWPLCALQGAWGDSVWSQEQRKEHRAALPVGPFHLTIYQSFNALWVCKGAHGAASCCLLWEFQTAQLPQPCTHNNPDKLLRLLIKVPRAKVRVQLFLMSRAFPGAHVMQGCSLMPAPLRAAVFTLRWKLPGTFCLHEGVGWGSCWLIPTTAHWLLSWTPLARLKLPDFLFPLKFTRNCQCNAENPQERPKMRLKKKLSNFPLWRMWILSFLVFRPASSGYLTHIIQSIMKIQIISLL